MNTQEARLPNSHALRRELGKDWCCPPSDPIVACALVLLAPFAIGSTDAARVAAWADLPVPFVARVTARLRTTKVWCDDTMCVKWPDTDDAHTSSILLLLDAMNGCGHTRRVDDDHFRIEPDAEQVIARVSGWPTSRERRAYEQRMRRAGMTENPSTRLRRARVAAGRCRECGKPAQQGSVRCAPHLERIRKYNADYRRRGASAAAGRAAEPAP